MKKACVLFILTLLSLNVYGRTHVIYSIEEDLYMGDPKQNLKKSYFVNIGENQGVREGSKLNVYRIISKLNPYDSAKRVNYKVKIGELDIIHADDEAAIGNLYKFIPENKSPVLEINSFMIGDHVSVSINDE